LIYAMTVLEIWWFFVCENFWLVWLTNNLALKFSFQSIRVSNLVKTNLMNK
jgi:hypothetical protein